LVKIVDCANKIHFIAVNIIIAMIEALQINPFFIIKGAVLTIFVFHIDLLKLPFQEIKLIDLQEHGFRFWVIKN